MHTSPLRFEDPEFGCVVEGLDLAKLDESTRSKCVELVYRYGLVIFRGQEKLSPHDELSFAKAFNHDTSGEQQSYTGGAAPQTKLPPPFDDIAVIGSFELNNYHGLASAKSGGVYPPWKKGQLSWHVDGYADTNPPPDLTVMRCIATPDVAGETLFRCARKQAARLAPTQTPPPPPPPSSSTAAVSSNGHLLLGDIPADCVRVRYRLAAEIEHRPMGYSLAWASNVRKADKGETYQQGNSGEGAALVNEANGTDWPLVLREPVTGQRTLSTTYHVASACVLDPLTGRVVRELGFHDANALVDEAWGVGGGGGAEHKKEEGALAEERAGGARSVPTTERHASVTEEEEEEEEGAGCPPPHPDVYAHAWEEGDLAAWSNRLVIHTATSTNLYAGQTRIHHRIRLRAAAEFTPEAWLSGGAHTAYEKAIHLR